MITSQEFVQLLPLAVAWAEQQEKHILQNGVQLTASQLVDAKLVQVVSSEKVKLLKVDQIPLPNEVSLKSAAQMLSNYFQLQELQGRPHR